MICEGITCTAVLLWQVYELMNVKTLDRLYSAWGSPCYVMIQTLTHFKSKVYCWDPVWSPLAQLYRAQMLYTEVITESQILSIGSIGSESP